jgi:uncharacterized protein YgiM (DUF1202 family)
MVGQGEALLATATGQINLSTGSGWRRNAAVTSMPSFLNAVALTALVDGCDGVVSMVDTRELRVRAGPGEGYVTIGSFADAEVISVLGINQSRGWYRVRFSQSHWLGRKPGGYSQLPGPARATRRHTGNLHSDF